MISSSIQSEWLKLRKRPMFYWIIGILLGLAFLYPIITVVTSDYLVVDTSRGLRISAGPGGSNSPEALEAAQQIREKAALPNSPLTVLGFIAGLGRVLMVVLGASLAGSEFSWGTARHLIGRTRNRVSYIAGKLIVLIAVALLLSIGIAAAGTLGGAVITPTVLSGAEAASITSSFGTQLILGIIGTMLSFVPYTLLAFFIALTTRSSVAAVGIGLVTLIIGEPILVQIFSVLGSPWSEIIEYTPYYSIQIIKEMLASSYSANLPENIVKSLMVLLGNALVLAGLAYASFRKKELLA